MTHFEIVKPLLTESDHLIGISGGEAKAILSQLGYFSTDTHFLSLRLEKADLDHIQEANAYRGRLSLEGLIGALCEQHVLDEKKREESIPKVPDGRDALRSHLLHMRGRLSGMEDDWPKIDFSYLVREVEEALKILPEAKQ